MQTKMLVKKPEPASDRTNNPVNNNHKNKPAENKKNVRTTDYKKLLQMMLNDPDAITREEFLFLQSIIGYRQAVAAREKAKLCKQQRKIEQTNVAMKPILLGRSNSEIKKDSGEKKEDTSSNVNSTKTPMQMKKDNGNTSASSSSMQHNLRAGLEKISGVDLSDVKVHQNSDKPRQVGALAYTQGNNIHIAPRQEKHLPHEGWHAVQQKQGRVIPTMQMKTGALVNDNAGLEKEADVMGAKAESVGSTESIVQLKKLPNMQQESKVIQRITQEEAMRLSKQNTHDANEGKTWNIKAGEYNKYVFDAQDMLRDIGYNLSKRGVDGKWSPGGETYKALLKFQKTCKDTYNGLKRNAPAQTLAQVNYMQGVEPTGKLDKATYNALKKEKTNKIIRVKEENERANKKKKELASNTSKSDPILGLVGASQTIFLPKNLGGGMYYYNPQFKSIQRLNFGRMNSGTVFKMEFGKGSGIRLDYGNDGPIKKMQHVDGVPDRWHWNLDGKTSAGQKFKSTHPYGLSDHQIIGKGSLGEGSKGALLNNASKAVKVGGRVLIVAGAGMDIYEVATSDDPLRTGAKKAGGWAGAWAGAKVGGAIGATIGTFIVSIMGLKPSP